ncbi:response regulator [Methylogaea oryzae]|uniref:Response regulatory domain-containing protein n=1 Tax=Methylogaea oryzae TaxID=1295382 RepID=A0A8D4VR78_9GAMM|nr:response regulator [Methylogaea oryzae]BBL71127.1 hypothetical protein MoryE10_17330 [Methylogaea oryzae]
MQILVVDDSFVIRARLVAAIEQMGQFHTVLEAELIEQALERFYAIKPDVVIADLGKQNRRGLIQLAKLRQGFPGAYIVAAVNASGQCLKTKLMSKGADAVFDKTLEYGAMLEALQALLAD